MTGQTPSNEWGVESSGFVTTEFSDYREKKNSVRGEVVKERMSITKKSNLCRGKKREKNERHNSLFFNAHSFTLIYYGAHTHRGLASFPSVGCSGRWCRSNAAYCKEVNVSYSNDYCFHGKNEELKVSDFDKRLASSSEVELFIH